MAAETMDGMCDVCLCICVGMCLCVCYREVWKKKRCFTDPKYSGISQDNNDPGSDAM